MKRALIIAAPIVVILIAILGYASNFINERYYWEPKYRHSKTHVPGFKYQIDKLVPFIVVVESEGLLNGKFVHERHVVLQFFGLFGKRLTYDRSENRSLP